MTKKLCGAVLVVGLLLLAASVVITLLAAGNANIIGGAGWPTLKYYFHKTGADWLAFVGVPVTVIAGVLLLRKK